MPPSRVHEILEMTAVLELRIVPKDEMGDALLVRKVFECLSRNEIDEGIPARPRLRYENGRSQPSDGRLMVQWSGCNFTPSNGLELTGDGGAAAGVRCSDVLGVTSPLCNDTNRSSPTVRPAHSA